MALETLKGVEKIGGFNVVVMDELREKRPDMFRPDGSMHYHLFEKEIRPFNFIYVRHDTNSLSFTLQRGPVKEVGVNGCQVDTLIHAAYVILKGLDAKMPCKENAEALEHLDKALLALEQRKYDRMHRGVEGENKH